MTLSEYFAARSGNQAALVRALGLPQTTVAHWASRSRAVPAEYVLSIESATKNAVSRKELLPNTWAAIWPELALADGQKTRDITESAIDAALAEARQVFAGNQGALDALGYVDGALSAMADAGEKAAAAMRAQSAQLVADAERTTGQAGRTRIDPTGDLSREVRTLSGRLNLRHEAAAQLLILAELRGMRAEQASDRFASGAVVLS